MSDDTHNEYSKNVGLQRRRKEKEGEGRREEVIITRKTRILPVIDLPLRGGGS
jgi:hypothetical protein